MTEIESGLFRMEVAMPYPPGQVPIAYYALPNVLGNAEAEEAAARIIRFSQEAGEWVGVSWPRLHDSMAHDGPEVQFTTTHPVMGGPQNVVNGIHRLLGEGHLTKERIGTNDVLLPTAQLVERIVQQKGNIR